MKYTAVILIAIIMLVSPLLSQSVEELTAEAERFATVDFDNQKALDKLLQAEKLAPANYEVLWRISRAYVDIGEHLPGATDTEKEKQLEYYQKALDYSVKAIEANPNAPTGYVRRAIANGRVALFKGVWSAIDFVKQTKADCEKAIAIDAKDHVAYYILGRTHAKLCEKSKMIRWPLGLGWANMEEAIKNYEKAISLRSNFIMYRLDAARAYVEEEDFKKAKEHLIAIAAFPKQDEDDDRYRKEAKELLEKIQNE
ncbi:MAG: tetratricopeptide repeat protein [Bacteroidota bacterium]